MTPLDHAIAALRVALQDEHLNRALYAAFAGAELFLLLEAEAKGDQVSPQLFPLDTGPVVLVFDTEERLSQFAGAAPYLALSGSVLVRMLAGKSIGVGINLGTSEEHILPAQAVDWMETAKTAPSVNAERPKAFRPPQAVPEAFLPSLDARLASFAGLAKRAVLTEAEFHGGSRGACLVVIDAKPEAEAAIAQSLSDAFVIMGQGADSIDIAFLDGAGKAAEQAMAVGLVIDLPEAEAPNMPAALDPEKPPRLR